MVKTHGNLERLCTKLQSRYGENDALVMQLKRELGSRESIEVHPASWTIPYWAFIKASCESAMEMPLSRRELSQKLL